MFSLFNFSSIFPGGQLTPFAPMYGRPWAHCFSSCIVYRAVVRARVSNHTELGAVADRSEPDPVATRNVPRLAGPVADHDRIVAAALQARALRRIEVAASEHCTPHAHYLHKIFHIPHSRTKQIGLPAILKLRPGSLSKVEQVVAVLK